MIFAKKARKQKFCTFYLLVKANIYNLLESIIFLCMMNFHKNLKQIDWWILFTQSKIILWRSRKFYRLFFMWTHCSAKNLYLWYSWWFYGWKVEKPYFRLIFTASRYPVQRHVHGVQAVFGILPDVPCKVNTKSQIISALF